MCVPNLDTNVIVLYIFVQKVQKLYTVPQVNGDCCISIRGQEKEGYRDLSVSFQKPQKILLVCLFKDLCAFWCVGTEIIAKRKSLFILSETVSVIGTLFI